MKKQKLLTIILSFLGVIGLSITLYFALKPQESDSSGSINVFLIKQNNNVIDQKECRFYENDTIHNVLTRNFYHVKITDGMLLEIGVLKTADDWSIFLSIYINDELSYVGINDIKLYDGMNISFVETVFDPNYDN